MREGKIIFRDVVYREDVERVLARYLDRLEKDESLIMRYLSPSDRAKAILSSVKPIELSVSAPDR